MAWFIRTLEIADEQGKGTGKWRLTATSDDPKSGPIGLCDHAHESPKDAESCAEARANEGPITGIPYMGNQAANPMN